MNINNHTANLNSVTSLTIACAFGVAIGVSLSEGSFAKRAGRSIRSSVQNWLQRGSASTNGAPPPKPTIPDTYTVPKVWKFQEQGGAMGGMNRPTAGVRSQKDLPIGEHDIQLYSLGTPNGHKVTILLEELGVEYDAWFVSIFDLDQFSSGFVDVNPNSKIPAMVDRGRKDGPLRVFESGSMLLYLADKYGRFIPQDPRQRTECLNWLFWQMASAPFIGGGFGHFYKYAPVHIEYAIDRYSMETKRQLDVLDKHLEGKQYICGDEYTIADMAIMPWIRCIDVFYNGVEFLQLESYANVMEWKSRLLDRAAVARGLRVNGMGPNDLKERHSEADFHVPEPEIDYGA